MSLYILSNAFQVAIYCSKNDVRLWNANAFMIQVVPGKEISLCRAVIDNLVKGYKSQIKYKAMLHVYIQYSRFESTTDGNPLMEEGILAGTYPRSSEGQNTNLLLYST